MHDVILGEQLEGFGNVQDDLSDLVLVASQGRVKLSIMDPVHLLVVVLLALELVKGVA